MKNHPEIMQHYYSKLEENVPYRLLSPFLKPFITKDTDYKSSIAIPLIDQLAELGDVPYRIWIDSQNRKGIDILDGWLQFFREQNSILLAWDQFEKALYLQKRNPSVPGIVLKVNWKHEGTTGRRHLKNARELWKKIAELYPDEFISIYTGRILDGEKFELDHFIPWSFTASNELFNLVPVEKEVNIKKSNHLPNWTIYFPGLVQMQSLLCRAVKEDYSVFALFEECRKDNLNEDWEQNELYNSYNNYKSIKTLLEKKIKPLWDTASMQGFQPWRYSNESK